MCFALTGVHAKDPSALLVHYRSGSPSLISPTVALKRSKSSASAHGGGLIESPRNMRLQYTLSIYLLDTVWSLILAGSSGPLLDLYILLIVECVRLFS